MPKKVFYSFHFKNDVMRVQQIRNIGSIEGNKPVSAQRWEDVKQKGDAAVQKWIDDNMKGKSCVIVLIGEETSNRKWVKYEIKKAWNDGRAIMGIYIHNIKCTTNGIGKKGSNPFDQFTLKNGKKLSSIVKCYNPNSINAYKDIATNIETWINDAIASRK